MRFIYNRTLDSIKLLYHLARKDFSKKAKKRCIHMVNKKKTNIKKGSKTTKTGMVQCCNKLKTKYFCCKHKKMKPKYDAPLNFCYWRNNIIFPNSELRDNEKWLAEIPFDTRQLVIKNVLAAYKSAITNLKNGNIKHFETKYLSKKNHTQLFFIDYRALNDNGVLWSNKVRLSIKNEKRRKTMV
jgi:hypothetical protein